jgi:hypothetical protein
MRSQFLCAAAFALQALAAPSWTSTPFNPPSIPLAVRSPYLNTWLPQGQGVALNDAWPSFWAGRITAWVGFVRVDGISYTFLGAPVVDGANFTKATQKSFSVSPVALSCLGANFPKVHVHPKHLRPFCRPC